MFDVIYQFLISLVAKILSWFGVSFGQAAEKASEESVSSLSASTPSSDAPPSLLPSGPVASDLSNSFSSQAAVVA
jgi:hypothetical protein